MGAGVLFREWSHAASVKRNGGTIMKLWKSSCFLAAIFVFSLYLLGAAPQETKKDKDPKAESTQKGDSAKKEAGKGDSAKGKEVFEANCAICHNADSEEDKVGPGLK